MAGVGGGLQARAGRGSALRLRAGVVTRALFIACLLLVAAGLILYISVGLAAR